MRAGILLSSLLGGSQRVHKLCFSFDVQNVNQQLFFLFLLSCRFGALMGWFFYSKCVLKAPQRFIKSFDRIVFFGLGNLC